MSAYRMRRGHYAASVTRLAVSQPVDRFTVQFLDGGRVVATRCSKAARSGWLQALFTMSGLQHAPLRYPGKDMRLPRYLGFAFFSAISTREMTKIGI